MNKQSLKFTEYILEKIYVIIFVVIIGAGLIASVLILTDIINKSSLDSSSLNNGPYKFNQAIIDKVDKLKISTDNTDDILNQTGRTNPFSE